MGQMAQLQGVSNISSAFALVEALVRREAQRYDRGIQTADAIMRRIR